MIPVATFLQGPQGRICRDLIWLHFPLVQWWQQKQGMLPAARASANIDSCVEQDQVCLRGLYVACSKSRYWIALHYVTLLAAVGNRTTPACTTSRFLVSSKTDEAFAKIKDSQSVHAQIAVHHCHVKQTNTNWKQPIAHLTWIPAKESSCKNESASCHCSPLSQALMAAL